MPETPETFRPQISRVRSDGVRVLIPDDVLKLIYVALYQYSDFGRPLDLDDIRWMVEYQHGITANATSLKEAFERFGNVNDPLTEHYKDLVRRDDNTPGSILWSDTVDAAWKDYRKKQDDGKARSALLRGTTTRLTVFAINWPSWGKQDVLRHHLAIIYPLVRFCKDENGSALSDLYLQELIAEKMFKGVYSSSTITQVLKVDTHKTTKLVASMIWPERHALGKNAHKMNKDFAAEQRLPEPKMIIPDSDVPPHERAITTGMAAMSVAAIAGPSRTSGGPVPRMDPVESSSHQPGEKREREDSSGSKSSDPEVPQAENGKGKGKEQETGQGKGKGKEFRRG